MCVFATDDYIKPYCPGCQYFLNGLCNVNPISTGVRDSGLKWSVVGNENGEIERSRPT